MADVGAVVRTRHAAAVGTTQISMKSAPASMAYGAGHGRSPTGRRKHPRQSKHPYVAYLFSPFCAFPAVAAAAGAGDLGCFTWLRCRLAFA